MADIFSVQRLLNIVKDTFNTENPKNKDDNKQPKGASNQPHNYHNHLSRLVITKGFNDQNDVKVLFSTLHDNIDNDDYMAIVGSNNKVWGLNTQGMAWQSMSMILKKHPQLLHHLNTSENSQTYANELASAFETRGSALRAKYAATMKKGAKDLDTSSQAGDTENTVEAVEEHTQKDITHIVTKQNDIVVIAHSSDQNTQKQCNGELSSVMINDILTDYRKRIEQLEAQNTQLQIQNTQLLTQLQTQSAQLMQFVGNALMASINRS